MTEIQGSEDSTILWCRRMIGVLLLVLAAIGITGWVGKMPGLTTILPGGSTMVFNTALCFALTGASLIALSCSSRKLASILTGVMGLFALATFLQYPFARSFGIDQLFWKQAIPIESPGRMAMNSSVAFMVTAVALLSLTDTRPRRRLLELSSGILMGMALMVLLGYAVGLRPSYKLGTYTMALPTAVGFGLVGIVIMLQAWWEKIGWKPSVLLAATAGTLLISLGLTSLRNAEVIDEANAWVRHTFEVRQALINVLCDLSVADATERSFNSTLEEKLLETFQAYSGHTKKDVEALITLVADNSLQTERAKHLDVVVKSKLDNMESLLAERHLGRPTQDQRAEEVEHSQELFSQVQNFVTEMLNEEGHLLQERLSRTELAAAQRYRLFIVAGIIAAALLGTAIALVHHEQKRRRRAEQELIRLNDELRNASAAAHESTRLKAQFLANMSHEVRTPMNGVVGMIGLLLNTRLSSEQRMLATTVSTSADALLTVLNDILDFSKIEAGELVFDPAPFDLRDPIESCLNLVSEKAHGKGLELAYLIEENVPTQLIGDAGRLHQVLLNLVSNAVKFTSHGEVVVRIANLADDNRLTRLRFSIQDSGLGISPEMQAKIFMPFVQADGGTARKFGGTGLGLAICRQLVLLMDGEIGVMSELGNGSTFWFTAEFPLQESVPRIVPRKPELAGMRALVVDDNETNREILTRQLAGWLIEPTPAGDGQSALAILKTAVESGTPFHLVVLDMQMPGMTGLDLARAIQADSTIADVKLLLLTSIGQSPARDELESSGIGAGLMKPVCHSQLYSTLLTLLASYTGEGTTSSRTEYEEHSSTTVADIKLRILVAEDNLVNQSVVRAMMASLGYSPIIVANGLQAITAVQAQHYDVVFMDCQMPDIDGFEATRRIREWEAECRSHDKSVVPLHIVAMTANAMVGDREACLDAGMDDYISKPMRAGDIVGAIARTPAAHREDIV